MFDSSNPFSTSDEKPKPPPPRKADISDKKPEIPEKKPEIPEKKPEIPEKKPEISGRKPVQEDKNVYSVPPPSLPPPRAAPKPQLNSQKSYPAPLPPQSRVKNLSLTRKQRQSSSKFILLLGTLSLSLCHISLNYCHFIGSCVLRYTTLHVTV